MDAPSALYERAALAADQLDGLPHLRTTAQTAASCRRPLTAVAPERRASPTTPEKRSSSLALGLAAEEKAQLDRRVGLTNCHPHST